ncbi:Acetylcholine receptor [Dirofilaria immitis]
MQSWCKMELNEQLLKMMKLNKRNRRAGESKALKGLNFNSRRQYLLVQQNSNSITNSSKEQRSSDSKKQRCSGKLKKTAEKIICFRLLNFITK